MNETLESPSANYADQINSLALTHLTSSSSVGSGGFVVATVKGCTALYDANAHQRLTLLSRTHTGADRWQLASEYLVYSSVFDHGHSVELPGSVPALGRSGAPTFNYALAMSPSVAAIAGTPASAPERVLAAAVAPATAPAPVLVSLSDILRSIRSIFGLTVTQIASVMLVQRVTIYDWMDSNSMDKMRPLSRERLKTLHGIAATWASKAPLYGKFLYEQIADGKCVFDLLTAPALDPDAFVQAYGALVQTKKPDRRKAEQVLQQRDTNRVIGVALRDAFKNFGS